MSDLKARAEAADGVVPRAEPAARVTQAVPDVRESDVPAELEDGQ
jgi:hypothetical protein